MAKLLSKDEILAADDLKSEVVDVPAWGGKVKVRTMNGTERDMFDRHIIESEKKGFNAVEGLRAILCALCVVDANGKNLFTQADLMALGKKSCLALDKVFAVAQRLNGLTVEAVKAAEKN